jgi:septal ring factor EnvC (AmiA/AmiB activator)
MHLYHVMSFIAYKRQPSLPVKHCMSDSENCDQESVEDCLKSLSKSKPNRELLKIRLSRKRLERKRLSEQLKRQKESLANQVSKLKTTEAKKEAVNIEIADLKQRLEREECMDLC